MNQKTGYFLLALLFFNYVMSQSILEEITFHSKSLENAILKVNTNKKLIIYLPPNYKNSTKKYPVIYYLPGFTSPIKDLLNGEYNGFKLKNVLDDLFQNKNLNEMIVVLCEGENYLGGNFYVNSPLTGNNEDYITEDVVNYVDTNYRTLKNTNSRGIAGHSMGGFGAFSIISKHPDIFGVCYSMSPGIYTRTGLHDQKLFDQQYKIDFLNGFLEEINSENEKAITYIKREMNELFEGNYQQYYYGFTFAYGSAFCYDLKLPFPHIAIPSHVTDSTNISKFKTLNLWQNGFGNWENKLNYNKLSQAKNIAFNCGEKDGWISEGTKYIIRLLKINNIKVDEHWHNGGHMDRLHIEIKNKMFMYFSEKLRFDH